MPSRPSPRPGLDGLAEVYRDLHAHPELAFAEHRTARIVAERLRAAGYETTTGVGGTGVVGVLRCGEGPTVAVRADMDALPVREQTGLPYASTARATDTDGREVPVMHACGHDMHVTCLLGAAAELAAHRDAWRGTLLLLFQPAEELGGGARAMVDDGLYERFGRPEVVLGQHVSPLPAGFVGLHPGPAFAAADSLRVVLHGRGGHGSRPEACVDPVLMAAATVQRLQGVVSREVAGTSTAVVTVGALHAGTKPNIIPDRAELLLSVRTYEPGVREAVLRAVERIVHGEAAASGAPREPEIAYTESFPAVVNDPAACERTRQALTEALGDSRLVDPGPATGSEDVGLLAQAAGAPCVYWLLGGADPTAFASARTFEDLAKVARGQPSNHSPHFAPVVEPTLSTGISALTAAARAWLGSPEDEPAR
ncbi:amidohydrolase [Streptomyces sp. NPDC006393]|uniref:amidohydrolase n=1 Tax=Streptomyces sp. NPDC006393 TaxID=3156763 RepID=UPI0033E2DF66